MEILLPWSLCKTPAHVSASEYTGGRLNAYTKMICNTLPCHERLLLGHILFSSSTRWIPAHLRHTAWNAGKYLYSVSSPQKQHESVSPNTIALLARKKSEKNELCPKSLFLEVFRAHDFGVLPLYKKSSKSLIKSESWSGQTHSFKWHFSWMLKSHWVFFPIMLLIIRDDFYESKPVGYTLRGSFIRKYAQICANIRKDKQREASGDIKLNTDDFD